MTSLLLSNSDVIRSIFTEKTQENAEKTQNPGNLLPPITQKIAEFLSLPYTDVLVKSTSSGSFRL